MTKQNDGAVPEYSVIYGIRQCFPGVLLRFHTVRVKICTFIYETGGDKPGAQ